jgi:hypothetical protein
MIGWLLNQLIEAIGGYVAQFCTWVVSQIASEGLVIFDQPVIQGIIAKIYTIGLGLWGIGCILAVFDLAIQYTKGSSGGVMDYCLNFVKGFLAANLFYALPVPVYKLFVKMGENIGYAITGSTLFYSDMWGSDAFTGNLLTGAVRALLILVVHLIMLICLIIVYFKFLKRGFELFVMIVMGCMYMISIPRGYMDGFVDWSKQTIGIGLSACLQIIAVALGSKMCVDHLFLGLAIFMASGNVDRLMQRFGIVQSASVNVFSIIHAAGSMRMMLGGRAGMRAAAAGAGGGATTASSGSKRTRGGKT